MRSTALTALCLMISAPGDGAANIGNLVCEDSTRLAAQMKVAHGARRHGVGMRGPDALMEVWVSPANADWLLVQVNANGTSCIVAIGENWEDTIAPAGTAGSGLDQ